MKKAAFFFLLFLSVVLCRAQENNGCDTVEPKYIVPMPGFDISNCEYSEFNELTFDYESTPGRTKSITAQGLYRRVSYQRPSDQARQISGTQIRNNYANAVVKAKGEILGLKKDLFRMKHEGRTIYIHLKYAEDNNDFGYVLEVIEERAMAQEVAVNLKDVLNTDGRIALYGILFDVDKAVIKPESEPELKNIGEYLKLNPTEKIIVVGHTDNTGNYDRNITLSRERAASVKNYLITKFGIDAARIRSEGAGQYCPVATNSTEEGKKKNRRVEIVRL